jgi:hypothetical protein
MTLVRATPFSVIIYLSWDVELPMLSCDVINDGVLHPQQAGAISRRVILDLLAALVYEIEIASTIR